MKERLAIYIDFHNVLGQRNKKYKLGRAQMVSSDWKNLITNLIRLYAKASQIPESEFGMTWTISCYSLDQMPRRKESEYKFSERMKGIATINGLIIKEQGKRKNSKKESGVDTYIISQMLLAAKRNLYDTAILVTNDNDYTPSVEILQLRYNKRVIQADYQNPLSAHAYLRNACFGNLDLNQLDEHFNFK